MADVEQDNPIIVNGNQVIVKNFLTQDYDIVSYFQNLEDSDNLGQKLENALKIGIVAMKSIRVAGNVDFVEKAFDNLDSKFKQNLESAFGDDGKFSEVLKDHFGEDGKIIKDLFDPNKVGTPLHTLQLDINRSLSEIRDKLTVNKAIEEVIEKSPQKGFNFEDECGEKLNWIARFNSDKPLRTSNDIGKISKSKRGDLL